MKIEKLTSDQELDLIAFRKQWLETGLSTKQIDFEKSKEVISGFYKRINKKPPIFLRFSSPMVTQLAMNFFNNKGDQLGDQLWDQLRYQLRDQLEDQLEDQLWDQLGDQLEDQLWDQLRYQLWYQLRDQLGDQLGGQLWDQLEDQLRYQLRDQLEDQLEDQLWDQLGDQLGGQLWDQLEDQLEDQLWDQLGDQLGGQYFNTWLHGSCESYWIAFYLFCGKIGVKYESSQLKLLNDWASLAESCFFWYPFENFCFLSERPEIIKFDNNKRLHDNTGASVKFRDGYSLYSWHGLRVPEYIITKPETITKEKIESEKNAEIRRVMLERFGFTKYFENCNADLIDEKEVWGQPVKLFRKNLDGVDMGFVHVINGTVEKDGTRHQFIIPCKIIDNCAERSVYGTYPDLIDRLKKWGYNDNQIMQQLANSIRT